jgi:hypothetical protein
MSEEIKEVTAADIVAPMLDTHPEIRPNAVIAENGGSVSAQPEPKPDSAPVEEFKDKTGEKFNPEKHYSDKYGRPQMTPGGYFRKIPLKKRLKRQAMKALGRSENSEQESEIQKAPESDLTDSPKTSETASEQASDVNGSPEPEIRNQSFIPDEEPQKSTSERAADEYRAAAKAICSTIFTIGVSVGGTQCKPLPQHVESMESAWEQYFRQKGKIDVPPGVAVALSTGGYALFCYQSSQLVQQQVGGIRGWIVRKIGNWRTNRAAKHASRTTARTTQAES